MVNDYNGFMLQKTSLSKDKDSQQRRESMIIDLCDQYTGASRGNVRRWICSPIPDHLSLYISSGFSLQRIIQHLSHLQFLLLFAADNRLLPNKSSQNVRPRRQIIDLLWS